MQRRKPIRVPPFAVAATGALGRISSEEEGRRWLKATIEAAWRAAGHSDVLVTVEAGPIIRNHSATSIIHSNLRGGLPPSVSQR